VNGLTLRSATPDDREFAYRVKKAALREYVEQIWGWNEAEQRRLHERRFAAQEFRVIRLGGTDVGTMGVVVAPDCLRLNGLFILPEYQGRGIGRRCMALLMEEARQLGLPVRLQVLKINQRALAFYERLGFTRAGETGTHDLMEWGA
jgi:ribosomal protein S18 acetylase RimI-like enzyme